MELPLTLPDVLANKLQSAAQAQRRSKEDVAVELLDQALEDNVKELANYFADSLAAQDPNEEFNLEEWQRNWDAVEAEMKAVTSANHIAEGRF